LQIVQLNRLPSSNIAPGSIIWLMHFNGKSRQTAPTNHKSETGRVSKNMFVLHAGNK